MFWPMIPNWQDSIMKSWRSHLTESTSVNVQALDVSAVLPNISVAYTDNILAISALVIELYILAASYVGIVVTPFE